MKSKNNRKKVKRNTQRKKSIRRKYGGNPDDSSKKETVNCKMKKFKNDPFCEKQERDHNLMKKYETICKNNPTYIGCPIAEWEKCMDPENKDCEKLREEINSCVTLPGNLKNSCKLIDTIYKDSFIHCNNNLINGSFFPYFCWYSYNKEKWNFLSKMFD
jgi:hypothetical protein